MTTWRDRLAALRSEYAGAERAVSANSLPDASGRTASVQFVDFGSGRDADVERLRRMVRFPTVSLAEDGTTDQAPFADSP